MSSFDRDELLALGLAGVAAVSVVGAVGASRLGGEASEGRSAPPPEPPAFVYRPEGVVLVPSVKALQDELAREGLQEPVARYAAEVSYKTDVIISRIAAARTGAEIGALWVEVGAADDPTLIARLDRIRAGLDALQPNGVAAARAASVGALVASHPPREQVVEALESLVPEAVDLFAHDVGEELIPPIAAGAWMQAYLILSLAMLDKGHFAPAHRLFFHPELGGYFLSYTEHAGPSWLPPALRESLTIALESLRQACERDPMGAADVAQVRDAIRPILGSL